MINYTNFMELIRFCSVFFVLLAFCLGQIPDDEISDLVDRIDAAQVYKALEITYEQPDFLQVAATYNIQEKQKALENFHQQYVQKAIDEMQQKFLNGSLENSTDSIAETPITDNHSNTLTIQP